jgi:hypothetical protein
LDSSSGRATPTVASSKAKKRTRFREKQKQKKNNISAEKAKEYAQEEHVVDETTQKRAQDCPYSKFLPNDAPDIVGMEKTTVPPRNRKEALTSVWWPHYFAAEKLEVETLNNMGTGVLAKKSAAYQAGCKVLKGRWAYDHKKDHLGVMFVKARYTVMGCFQTQGVDYGELYAPVMNLKSFRTMLQLLNLDPSHEAEQWDVKSAYLYADLEEEVYCDQPIGHEESQDRGHCWRLKKSLYGLKQAGRNFNKLLSSWMKKAGFSPVPNDPGTYIRKDKTTGGFCSVCMHVDDL